MIKLYLKRLLQCLQAIKIRTLLMSLFILQASIFTTLESKSFSRDIKKFFQTNALSARYHTPKNSTQITNTWYGVVNRAAAGYGVLLSNPYDTLEKLILTVEKQGNSYNIKIDRASIKELHVHDYNLVKVVKKLSAGRGKWVYRCTKNTYLNRETQNSYILNIINVAFTKNMISALMSNTQILSSKQISLHSQIARLRQQIATKGSWVASDSATIKKLNAQIADQKSQIASLKQQITTKGSSIANDSATITNLNAQIADQKSQIASLKQQITTKGSSISSDSATITKLKSQIADQKSQISTFAAQIADQKLSEQDEIKILDDDVDNDNY